MKGHKKLAALGFSALFAGGLLAAPSVEITNVQQQYPWTNTVDITYTVQGVSKTHQTNRLDHIVNDTYFATFEAKNGNTPIADVNGNTIFTNGLVQGNGTFTAQWQPKTDLQLTGCTMTPSVFRGEENAYLVINLETNEQGKCDWWYEPMSTQEESNKRYNTDEYKTKKMVFRRIPAGRYTLGYNLAENQSFNSTNMEHEVYFPTDYYYAIFKLTYAQYDRIVDSETPSMNMTPLRGQTWAAMRGGASSNTKLTSGIIYKLVERTSLAIDFPTHAMYETAARATSRKLYLSGDTFDNLLDWAQFSQKAPQVVGLKKANNWGLYDICGNGWSPCIDLGSPNIGAEEAALANGFMPVTNGPDFNRITCVEGNYGDWWKSLHAASLSSSSGYPKNNGQYFNRLAIYPAQYYPNGGK